MEEMEALKKNEIWQIVSFPPGKKNDGNQVNEIKSLGSIKYFLEIEVA